MTEMRDAINFVGFWRSPPPMPPSPDATILNYLNDSERGRHSLLLDFGAPPPHTPQYLTILMTERGGGAPLSFVRFWRLPMTPPPPPDDTILNYLNVRERGGAPLSFCRILTPPMPPTPTIPKYFTILMTEMRDSYFCRILAPPNAPPPSPDAKILSYLNDRERGRHCLL